MWDGDTRTTVAWVGASLLMFAVTALFALWIGGVVDLFKKLRSVDDRERAERVIDGARVSEPVVQADPPVWEAVTGEAWGDATTEEIARIKDDEEAQVSEQGERLVSLRRPGEATVNGTGPGDHAQLGPFRGIRVECHECQGVGYVLKSVNDLLRESLGLLGDAGDAVVTEFYRRLIDADNGKPPADQLASLFPPDLLTDDRTRGQRDKLLKALTALADWYVPDDPALMGRLDTALRAYGRSHALFVRPDGSVRGATLQEYAAVQTVLMGTLRHAAGKAWLPEYDAAWAEAYDHAAPVMLAEAHRAVLAGEVTMPRMPREARDG
jgi:hemoglobin-like flavoprotein